MGKRRGLQSSSVAALLPGDVAIKAALEREREKEAMSSSFALLWLAISLRNIEEGILVLIITRGPSGWWEDFPAAQMQQYYSPSMDLWTSLSTVNWGNWGSMPMRVFIFKTAILDLGVVSQVKQEKCSLPCCTQLWQIDIVCPGRKEMLVQKLFPIYLRETSHIIFSLGS